MRAYVYTRKLYIPHARVFRVCFYIYIFFIFFCCCCISELNIIGNFIIINNKSKMEKVQEIKDTARLPRPETGRSWMAVQPQTTQVILFDAL